MEYEPISAARMNQVRPVSEADDSDQENQISFSFYDDQPAKITKITMEQNPDSQGLSSEKQRMSNRKPTSADQPSFSSLRHTNQYFTEQSPPSRETSYLISTSMFEPTLSQQKDKKRLNPTLSKIFSFEDPNYLNSLKALFKNTRSLDKLLDDFLGNSNHVYKNIPEWIKRIESPLKRLIETKNQFGDLGNGDRVYSAWKAVDVLVDVVEEVLREAKKFADGHDCWAEHGFLRDCYSEMVLEALRDSLRGLDGDLEAGGVNASELE